MYVPLEITSFFGVGFPARAFCHDRMSFYQNSWYQTEFTLVGVTRLIISFHHQLLLFHPSKAR